MSLNRQISVQSAAMFSTWVHFPSDNICFDMGDGMVSRLRHKVVPINTVAISHGHRDHVAGMLAFLSIRCNHPGKVTVYYPQHSRVLDALGQFAPRFSRNADKLVEWKKVRPGDMLPLSKKNLFLQPFATTHYKIDDDRIRSLGYKMVETKKKVRAKYRDMTQQEIFALIKASGREAVLEDVEEVYLTYSGDTSVMPVEEMAGTPVLFHEATFLNEDDRASDEGEARYHMHSTLDEVMTNAVEASKTEAGLGHLVLYHFSSRYGRNEIREAMTAAMERFNPSFSVSVALPGAFVPDILANTFAPDNN